MNKYTLTFKDKQMELQFRKFKTATLQFPTLSYVTFGGAILLVINLVVHLINENFKNASKNGVAAFVLIVTWIWMKKQINKRNYCNTILFIINFTLVIFEVDSSNPESNTFFDGYLFGSNQQLVHTILMFANNLNCGVISNLGLSIAKILIYYYQRGNPRPDQYIYTVVASLSFVFIQYVNEKYYRCSFASSLRESRWEKMIPIFLKKPYILFSFDNESNNYELLNGNQLSFFESETPISNLLYTSKTINGLQLSTFIKNMDQESLQLEDSSAPLYRHTLEIEYLHKKITISLIAWNFEKIVYAVIIESEDPLIKKQQQVFKRKIKKCQDLLNLQISPINKVLGTCLSEVFHPLIRNLRISLIEVFYQQSTFKVELKLVSMKKLLDKCIKLFSSPGNYITVVCDDDLKFITLRQALITFIFEILKVINENQSLYIEVTKKERVALQISGLKYLPQTKLFIESRDILIDKTIRFQESFIFFFVAKPKLAFTQIQSLKK